MRGISIVKTEHQKKRSISQNQALYKQILKKNNKKKLKEISQIIRFGDELVIAIRIPIDKELLPSGSVGTIYTAHPVKKNGSINTKIELMVKIIRNSAVTQNEDEPKDFKRTQAETRNGNYAYSSRMTAIPRPQAQDGQTIYDTAIVMSKVSGIPLNITIQKNFFRKLTPPQRLCLCINTISFFIALHQIGIFQGDVKAENFIVDLDALLGTAIDIDPSYSTEETKAPEAQLTALSDAYSIAKDILTPILSDIRPIVEDEAILKTILMNPLSFYFKEYKYDIYDLLAGMQHSDPLQRTTLVKAKAKLESILEQVAKKPVVTAKILKAQRCHYQKLQILETVLEDPDYKLSSLYHIPDNKDGYEQSSVAEKSSCFSSASSFTGLSPYNFFLVHKAPNLGSKPSVQGYARP